MTRDELITAIHESEEAWPCPDHSCVLRMKCAEKQLAEYEAKVRADESTKVLKEVIEVLGNDYWTITKIQVLRGGAEGWLILTDSTRV